MPFKISVISINPIANNRVEVRFSDKTAREYDPEELNGIVEKIQGNIELSKDIAIADILSIDPKLKNPDLWINKEKTIDFSKISVSSPLEEVKLG